MISVIIPTLNRFELLDAALASVAAQSVRNHIEVIVVNDGGPSVAPVVRAWQNVLTIKLAELDRRVGPAAARNVGIQLAGGKYIAFLDDDDLFLPEHLAAGCKLLESAETDFVYLGAVVADRRLSGPPLDHTQFPLKAYPYDDRFLMVANFIHTGSVITRNFRHTSVRFDEALAVCEDWDLWIALTNTLGYRVSFIDKIQTIYHQVPDVVGLVASAQLTSPSAFELARDYIYAKWPSDDPVVLTYREWLITFERFRSDLIARKRPMPNLLFDEILRYLHRRISHEEKADYADISRFFDLGEYSSEELDDRRSAITSASLAANHLLRPDSTVLQPDGSSAFAERLVQ
jgi:glycosyltransferase involved in cell wall biosynthesis